MCAAPLAPALRALRGTGRPRPPGQNPVSRPDPARPAPFVQNPVNPLKYISYFVIFLRIYPQNKFYLWGRPCQKPGKSAAHPPGRSPDHAWPPFPRRRFDTLFCANRVVQVLFIGKKVGVWRRAGSRSWTCHKRPVTDNRSVFPGRIRREIWGGDVGRRSVKSKQGLVIQ